MFDRILIPLDGSPLAECVLSHGVALSRAFGSHCTLVRVLETECRGGRAQPVDPLDWTMSGAEAQAYLDSQVEALDAVNVDADAVLLEGQPAKLIVEHARASEVDLILLSSHGSTGLTGWNLNSVVHKVTQNANVSIMLVRAYQPEPDLATRRYRRMLIPLDGSSRAECVLGPATRLARFHGAEVLLCHGVARPELPRRSPFTPEDTELLERWTAHGEAVANEYFASLRTRMPLDFRALVLVSDDIAKSLHELSDEEEVDLVVMSAHGHSGTNRWPFGHLPMNFLLYGSRALLIVQDVPARMVQPTEAEMAARQHKGH